MNDIKRPKQPVKREIKRSNIALDEYMFDRKMKSLYYGVKPKSDDTPKLIRWLIDTFRAGKKWVAGTLQNFSVKNIKKLPKVVSAHRRPAYATSAALLVLLAVGIEFTVARGRSDTGSNKGTSTQVLGAEKTPTTTSRVPLNQTPEFSVVLPEGKTAADLGGFAKVSPSGVSPTYAYVDRIGNIQIQVSEQLLPDTLKTDPSSSVQKLAIGFNATQSVKTEKNEFFIGSAGTGEQSVITYTKTLLILIKSSAKVTNERWTAYINALQ